MAPDIHLSKGADIPNSDHFHSEVPEEVNDFQGFVSQEENKDERSNNRA